MTYHFRDELKEPNRNPQGYISLAGTLDGNCRLTHDRNWVSFTPFGDVGSSTLMGFMGSSFQLQEQPVKDPLNQGRRVFQLMPGKQQQLNLPLNNQADAADEERPQYTLVTSPTTAGARRLLIRKGEKVQHVLPLYDPNWQRFQEILAQLERTSPREQQAIAEIRNVVGSRFRFRIEQDQITSISFSGESGRDETLKHLKDLPHLRSLDLSHCRSITPQAYEVLESLSGLESLSFYRTPINDSVLTHIESLAQLKFLRIYDELPRGTTLADVPHITDRGVASLVKLDSLQNLSLYGDGVTDASVKLLVPMNNIKSLHLQNTAITFGGLVQLQAGLPAARIDGNNPAQNHSVRFSENSVSIQGNVDEQALRHLPTLKKSENRKSEHGESDRGWTQASGRFAGIGTPRNSTLPHADRRRFKTPQ